ncbi:hypothetical protein NDU88_007623 [Pleurodeles waltl]|uniref:Uncharacterized protein n=1 Tax=Pleurodeles waltl TaxID=8319 RepID=A0AAV7N7F6_PLEWA|nr:hypothetical protein NDU88_007623 [Pleurodeles waltl]
MIENGRLVRVLRLAGALDRVGRHSGCNAAPHIVTGDRQRAVETGGPLGGEWEWPDPLRPHSAIAETCDPPPDRRLSHIPGLEQHSSMEGAARASL